MGDAFQATKSVRKTNRKLAEKNASVLNQLRGVATEPHFLTDQKQHQVFPAPYVDQSLQEKADRYQIKQQLARKAGKIDEGAWYTQVNLSDEDVDFVIRQSELQELLEYDKQFMELFDVTNASELERFRSIYPAFFEKRKEYCRQIVKMQIALAKISLMGVQTKSDLDLVINIQALEDGGEKLMELLAIPVHYLVLANTDDFLQSGKKWEHTPRTGTPAPYAIRAEYKNKAGNLQKVGAGWLPNTSKEADGAPRYNMRGVERSKTARGAVPTGSTDWFSSFMKNASLS